MAFETSMANLRDILPPPSPHLLTLPKSVLNWKPNIQIPKNMGDMPFNPPPMPSSILINNTKPQKQHKHSSVEEGLIITLLDMVFWVSTEYVYLIMQKMLLLFKN